MQHFHAPYQWPRTGQNAGTFLTVLLVALIAAMPAHAQTAPPSPSIGPTYSGDDLDSGRSTLDVGARDGRIAKKTDYAARASESDADNGMESTLPMPPDTATTDLVPDLVSGTAAGASTYQGTCLSCGCNCQYSRCHHCGGSVSRWEAKKAELQASHWGYPEFFCERPFGSQQEQALAMQIANGLAQRQVLFHFDFLPGKQSHVLSPRGRYQLAKILGRLHLSADPRIVIQQDLQRPELDKRRTESVRQVLIEMGRSGAAEMLVVGRPVQNGISGEEARIIYTNQLQQTRQRGIQRSRNTSARFSGNTGVGDRPGSRGQN